MKSQKSTSSTRSDVYRFKVQFRRVVNFFSLANTLVTFIKRSWHEITSIWQRLISDPQRVRSERDRPFETRDGAEFSYDEIETGLIVPEFLPFQSSRRNPFSGPAYYMIIIIFPNTVVASRCCGGQ